MGPVALGILFRGGVGGGVVDAGVDDLTVLQDTTDIDLGRAVGWGSGVLHHDGRVRGCLEVDEVPASSWFPLAIVVRNKQSALIVPTCVVRLHALQSGDEHSAAGQIVGLLLGGNGALDGTAGPEAMVHRAPGVLGVCSEVGGTVLANSETGRLAGEFEVHDAVRVDGGLDGVGVALLVEGDGHVVGAEGQHLLIEHEVVQGVRVPDVRALAVEVEDLRVEVRGGVDAPTD